MSDPPMLYPSKIGPSNWDILSEILSSDITIGQNEDFILYVLSNKFIVNHVNKEIHFIELEKKFFVIQEANKIKIDSNQLKKESLLFLFLKTSVTLWKPWFSFVFRG